MLERVETNWFTLSAEDLGEMQWKSIRICLLIVNALFCFPFIVMFVVTQLAWPLATSIPCAAFGMIIYGQKKVIFAKFRKPIYKHSVVIGNSLLKKLCVGTGSVLALNRHSRRRV